MAVIESALALCIAVNRQMEARRSEGREPTKVLMSQRQLDALNRALQVSGAEQGVRRLWGLPIVICPDCDLYVPS